MLRLTTPESANEFIENSGSAVILTSAVLSLGLLWAGIAALYESKLLMDTREIRWVQSQREDFRAGAAPVDDDTEIVLERTQCFGTCPAYRVTISGSGRVNFDGTAFVCERAPPPSRIDAREVQKLLAGLREVDYFSMPNYTSYDVTDMASAMIEVRTRTMQHSIKHYLGDRSAPRLLRWIEARIDSTANSSRWIGTYDPATHARACAES